MQTQGAITPAVLCLAVALAAGSRRARRNRAARSSPWCSRARRSAPPARAGSSPAARSIWATPSAPARAAKRRSELADDTRLVVGPNSSMVVDAFVFDRRGTAKQVTLNAVRGAFRFITGSSRKSAYQINTPTATIGVRGTQFDFSVDRRGQLNFALFEGQARICSRGGRCTVLSGACSVAVIPRSGAARRLPAGNERTRLLRTIFPYIASQRRPEPRLPRRHVELQRPQGGYPAGRAVRRRASSAAASSIFAPPGTSVDPGRRPARSARATATASPTTPIRAAAASTTTRRAAVRRTPAAAAAAAVAVAAVVAAAVAAAAEAAATVAVGGGGGSHGNGNGNGHNSRAAIFVM